MAQKGSAGKEKPKSVPDPAATEQLYHSYSHSCKRFQLFPCFLFATFLYSSAQIGIHLYWWTNLAIHWSESTATAYTIYFFVMLFLGIIGSISSVVLLIPRRIIPDAISTSNLTPHFMVWLWTGTILASIALRMEETLPLRLGLGWVILEIFLILITFPARLQIVLIYTTTLSALHTGVVLWRGRNQPLVGDQLAANIILIIGAHVIGRLGYRIIERKQRIAFEDSCQSLEVKDVMSVHAEEQQRLLLSVLPKHLVETMTQDSETSEGSGGFKKIYMQRHEPVSILFADIVGFTAMSAALGSASKLVEILDELFSMFDNLAEKHSQVRIKILGDCYYCICGAPEERPDHAILCVHMGLAVVEAIKYFQKRTNTAVDMRVGIHTGAVLAGILGQRQWQFDVYSKDVDLANIMESGGIPGKVHVSDKTLSFLNGEFEVEPGFGETREEGLRLAGIKTYFITKVLKPFKAKSSEKLELSEKPTADTSDNQLNRLRSELLSQDGEGLFPGEMNYVTLRFLDETKEEEFGLKAQDETDGIAAYVGCYSVIAVITTTSFLVISFSIIGLFTTLLGLITLCGMGIASHKANRSKSRRALATNMIKNMFGLIAIIVLTTTNLVLMIPCIRAGDNGMETTNATIAIGNWPTQGCRYPSYLIIYCTLLLLSATLFSSFYFGVLSFVSLLVLVGHLLIFNLTSIEETFHRSEVFSFKNAKDLMPEIVLWTAFGILFFFAFVSLTRRLELSARIRFLCKSNLGTQKEKAKQLKLKNEALMCNIMPTHVANHFLNSKNKEKGLYSENYLEAGVIFAAMPNFRDFYTEDAVNNQGLECLRFLNEVISDYDAVLDLAKYNGEIIKIKTIGSTYMAASGLNREKEGRIGNSLKERWRHLSLLVEFALDMKKVLNQINEQSYNQFVLKIGICHGPITAGVIGNTKPAYDIWGNTANVSSRMYSTGKADKIQVTDETYKILRMYGYQFERRGFISVKGKGDILTYFLTGTGAELTEDQIQQLSDEFD